jgi:hypothetical protein
MGFHVRIVGGGVTVSQLRQRRSSFAEGRSSAGV